MNGETNRLKGSTDSQDAIKRPHDSIASAAGHAVHWKSAQDHIYQGVDIEKYKHKPGDMTIPYYSIKSEHHHEPVTNT